MQIKPIIAVSLLFAAASAQATTNSWQTASTFWNFSSAWSAGFPSITNEVNLITNLTTKVVTINNTTALSTPTTLTISNLVVGAPATNGSFGTPQRAAGFVTLNTAQDYTGLTIVITGMTSGSITVSFS